MSFSLYHIPSGNQIGDYDDESAAFRAVLQEIEENENGSDLGLEAYDERGNREVVAIGEELSALASDQVRLDEPVVTTTIW